MEKKLKNEVKKNYHQAVQTGKPLSFQLNTVRLGREINEYHYFRVALCYKNALCEFICVFATFNAGKNECWT